MAHVLLILPTTTYRASDFIEAADRLGIELTIATEEPGPFELPTRRLVIDCDDAPASAAAIVSYGDDHPIDAVVAADDQGVELAALAAQQLGLPHNPPFGVAATRNKAMLRRALVRAEVPQPAFGLVNSPEEAADAAADLGPPVVLKPLSLSASQGVIRADSPDAARAAAERIRRILIVGGRSPGEPILVERFVPGAEVSVEGMLSDGRLEVLAVFDKPDPLEGPYFEETILVTPSELHPEMIDEVIRVTQSGIDALQLREGPIHAELRIEGAKATLIEIAARSVGGLCGRSLRFGLLGTSLESLILRSALAQPTRGLRRQATASGAMMIPIPRSGTFRRVEGRAEALAVPGISDIEMSMHPGDQIQTLPEGNRYLGFIFATGEHPREVTAALRRAHSQLQIIID